MPSCTSTSGCTAALAFNTLVSSAELAAHLGDWRIFDCRHDLAKPELGAELYREAHIPGALFASLDRDLSGPKTGKNGRHPLPDAKTFGAWLGRQGLKRGDQVVCYDAANGAMAARLWWMLRWVGHDEVAVLDGGFAKWQAEGRAVTAEVPRISPTELKVAARTDMVAGSDPGRGGHGVAADPGGGAGVGRVPAVLGMGTGAGPAVTGPAGRHRGGAGPGGVLRCDRPGVGAADVDGVSGGASQWWAGRLPAERGAPGGL